MEATQLVGRQVPTGRLQQARRAGAPLLLLLALLALIGYRMAAVLGPRALAPHPWPIAVSASATVDVGVTTPPLGRNEWRAWRSGDLDSVNAFEHVVRTHVSVVMWYADWQHSALSLAQLRAVARRGSTPEITWEPWDYTKGLYRRQPRYTLRSIIDGRHDAYIRAWARALAAYGGRVRLRFAQEMNGNWYPWAELANGNRHGQFVQAWRHVHDVFRGAGADNVQWVWSPVALARSITAEQYPGDSYLDLVGLSLFNGGAQLKFGPWKSFAAKTDRPLALLHKIAPRKRIELSEVGVAEQGGDKAQWITGMFQTLQARPEISSLIWYDLRTSSDWRVDTSRSAEAAFAAGVRDPRYR